MTKEAGRACFHESIQGKWPNMMWNVKEQFLFVAGKGSKNSFSTDLLFRWGQQMTWLRTHGMGMIGSEKDTSCQNLLDILFYSAGALKIWINAESFWVQVSYLHCSCPQDSPELPEHRETELDFPNTTSVVSLNNIQFLQHPWVSNRAMYFWQPTQELVWLCQMRAQNCPPVQMPTVFSQVTTDLTKCLKLGTSIALLLVQ